MHRHLLAGVALTVLLGAPPAKTADMLPRKAPPVPASFSWTGGYIGISAGGAWGSYDTSTSTAFTPGGYFPNAAVAAAVNAAGSQSIKPSGFATGIAAGYNWQTGRFLLGVEADLQGLELNGAANSGAVPYPGFHRQFVVSSYADSTWLFTARARVGLVAGNNSLVYATGGLAVTRLNSDFLFTDTFEQRFPVHRFRRRARSGKGRQHQDRLRGRRWGRNATDGAVEPQSGISLREVRRRDRHRQSGPAAEPGLYPYRRSDGQYRACRSQLSFRRRRSVAGRRRHAGQGAASADTGQVRLGGGDGGAPLVQLRHHRRAAAAFEQPGNSRLPAHLQRPGRDLRRSLCPRGSRQRMVRQGIPRCRQDHARQHVRRGFSSLRRVFEYIAIQQFRQHRLRHDRLGYTFLRVPGAKVGAFVGYNYYHQRVNTYGCTQLAGDAVCVPAGSFPSNFLGIAEDDRFNSLRLGLSAQVMLTDRLRLTADAAYLPLVDFKGQDDHNARELLIPEASSAGNGVMLEAILDYAITDAWRAGVGGRYWAWNMRTGAATFNFLGSNEPPLVEPARFNSERYGAFVQTSYRWGDTTPAAAATRLPTKAPVVVAAAMNWTGFHIGAHLGGGWSNDRWSDPFGSTPAGGGFFNVAGFGDAAHATGPLGGGQIGFNLQSGQWVFGVEADASAADLRGENTCFSGLGGINCERIVNALGTITSRLGYAWDRSLAYVKGGGAWTDTTYTLNANTNALTLGTGSTGVTAWGWTVGGGIEYGLTNNWTVLLEYAHIEVPGTTVPFPAVSLINAQHISVRQWIDVVKLGVNYKFDWNPFIAIH